MSNVSHGRQGEAIVEQLLRYEGHEIIERQPLVHGHRLDLRTKHPQFGEALYEVKVWVDPRKVGTDNVKKAIGVAYDLWAAGETTPYILVLSHHLTGLYRDMLLRAVHQKVIHEVRVLGFLSFGDALDEPGLSP
jgi:hypothetical protein